MATRSKTHLAPHTAGIYSDNTVDGPQIGTLVLVVDRAKNLPNRKTIGKQDPYCAARLGKEAKKTTTDIRGGQTPKWDQELRFIVHDSPDYYQLKVSVFNDDKKTELIGEKWIDLADIILEGGGQADQWHTLTCRGKYAGEVRIETTFYDSRRKPEKKEDVRTTPKRRPLPSEPVTTRPVQDRPLVSNTPRRKEVPSRMEEELRDDGEMDHPPPPPVHRSNNSIVSLANEKGTGPRKTPVNMRQDVLRTEAYRHTSQSPTYPGRPIYNSHDSAPTTSREHVSARQSFASYDARPMQATVEDVPDHADDWNMARPLSTAWTHTREHYDSHYSLTSDPSHAEPMHPYSPPAAWEQREYSTSHSPPVTFTRHSHSQSLPFTTSSQSLMYHHVESDYRPPVPVSLVPGMDPSIGQPERLERSHARITQHALDPIPDWQDPDPYSRGRAAITYPGSAMTEYGTSSPSPIKRKSISPAPSQPVPSLPFGPDSYIVLNPNASVTDSSARPNHQSGGKIVTYDGREIDPSDHLPMETWAPEPEPKPPSGRPTPAGTGGPRPTPPSAPTESGRRQLRIALRPQRAQVTYSNPVMPTTDSSPARNKLQKKRSSTVPVPFPMMSGANGSSRGKPLEEERWRPQTADNPSFAPPIPEKIPLALPSSAISLRADAAGYDSGRHSLLEEMRRIDIGTGRSRRHGHGY